MPTKLRVHSFLPLTYANGPGARACLWLQGCTLDCPGCFNPDSHERNSGSLHEVSEVADWIAKAANTESEPEPEPKSEPEVKPDQDHRLEGLTITGGEPLEQAEALTELLKLVRREEKLSIIVFTGFTYKEAETLDCFATMKGLIDVLICGRYQKHIESKGDFPGSGSKTIHYLSDRYNESDLAKVPLTEIIISNLGDITITGTGTAPPQLRK